MCIMYGYAGSKFARGKRAQPAMTMQLPLPQSAARPARFSSPAGDPKHEETKKYLNLARPAKKGAAGKPFNVDGTSCHGWAMDPPFRPPVFPLGTSTRYQYQGATTCIPPSHYIYLRRPSPSALDCCSLLSPLLLHHPQLCLSLLTCFFFLKYPIQTNTPFFCSPAKSSHNVWPCVSQLSLSAFTPQLLTPPPRPEKAQLITSG